MKLLASIALVLACGLGSLPAQRLHAMPATADAGQGGASDLAGRADQQYIQRRRRNGHGDLAGGRRAV